MKKLLLKTMLLLCALVVGSASVWAEDEKFYTLTPTSGSNSAYASDCDVTVNGITWNLTGNSQQIPWRIGGKSLSKVDRALYSKTAISENVSKIEVTHGAASSITVTNWTLIVSKNSDFSNPVSELTPSFKANATTTINRPDGKDWSNCYFKFIYRVTVSSTSNKFVEFSSAAFYKEADSGSSDPVAVEGVSLDKTSLELEAGSNATLIATVAPAEATDKVVTWSSSDEDVATVEDGVVTAVSAGTATITVTTHDGSKKATCAVTVTAAPAIAVTLDFATNILGLPEGSANKETDEAGFTYGGYTYTFKAGTGYYFNSDGYVIFGKSGSTLTFPAFPFNVSKIKVYGKSGASASVVQNIYVGDEEVSTATTGAEGTNEYAIDPAYQAKGNVYVLKVTSAHNTQITKIEVFGYTTITLSDACTDGEGNYYGTYSNSSAFSVPEGLTVSTVSVADGKLTKTNYKTGDVVKANTGVLVSATTPGAKTIQITTGGTELAGNMLKASGDAGIDAASMNVADTKFYRLTMHEGTQIGFFWGAEDGAAFSVTANKAYLAVPNGETGAVRGFNLNDGADAISEIMKNEKMSAVYDLSGRRVVKATKGLYIVNGKKVVK